MMKTIYKDVETRACFLCIYLNHMNKDPAHERRRYIYNVFVHQLTHWGRMTYICVRKQTNIGSDNGLSPGRRQAIIWTNAVILLIGTLGTNFSEILIEIRIFSFKKMGLKVSSAKWRPFCLGLNVLNLFIGHTQKWRWKFNAEHLYINQWELFWKPFYHFVVVSIFVHNGQYYTFS